MIKTNLLGFVVTMHVSGMYEQYAKSFGLRPWDWDFLFACTLNAWGYMQTESPNSKAIGRGIGYTLTIKAPRTSLNPLII